MKELQELKQALNILYQASRKAPLDADIHDTCGNAYKLLFDNLDLQEAASKQPEKQPEKVKA